jgi:hypothetical protein
MKSLKSNSAAPLLDVDAPAAVADIYLEVEPPGYGKFLRLPAHVEELNEAGVILEVPDLPSEVRAESLVDQIGIVHVPSDGLSPATQLRATVGGVTRAGAARRLTYWGWTCTTSMPGGVRRWQRCGLAPRI